MTLKTAAPRGRRQLHPHGCCYALTVPEPGGVRWVFWPTDQHGNWLPADRVVVGVFHEDTARELVEQGKKMIDGVMFTTSYANPPDKCCHWVRFDCEESITLNAAPPGWGED